jgi:hypothetical protein
MIKKNRLESESSELMALLYSMENAKISPAVLRKNFELLYKWRTTKCPGDTAEAIERHQQCLQLENFARELGNYYYFVATVLEFFNDELSENQLKKAETNGQLDLLARARQNMALDSKISILALNRFRRHWQMTVPPVAANA